MQKINYILEFGTKPFSQAWQFLWQIDMKTKWYESECKKWNTFKIFFCFLHCTPIPMALHHIIITIAFVQHKLNNVFDFQNWLHKQHIQLQTQLPLNSLFIWTRIYAHARYSPFLMITDYEERFKKINKIKHEKWHKHFFRTKSHVNYTLNLSVGIMIEKKQQKKTNKGSCQIF